MAANENRVKKPDGGVQGPDLKKRPMRQAAGMNGGMPAICGKLPVKEIFEAVKQRVVAVSGELQGNDEGLFRSYLKYTFRPKGF